MDHLNKLLSALDDEEKNKLDSLKELETFLSSQKTDDLFGNVSALTQVILPYTTSKNSFERVQAYKIFEKCTLHWKNDLEKSSKEFFRLLIQHNCNYEKFNSEDLRKTFCSDDLTFVKNVICFLGRRAISDNEMGVINNLLKVVTFGLKGSVNNCLKAYDCVDALFEVVCSDRERLHRTRFKKLAKAAYGKTHHTESLISRKIYSWWKFIIAQEYSDDSTSDMIDAYYEHCKEIISSNYAENTSLELTETLFNNTAVIFCLLFVKEPNEFKTYIPNSFTKGLPNIQLLYSRITLTKLLDCIKAVFNIFKTSPNLFSENAKIFLLETCLSYMRGKVVPNVDCMKSLFDGIKCLLEDKILSRNAIPKFLKSISELDKTFLCQSHIHFDKDKKESSVFYCLKWIIELLEEKTMDKNLNCELAQLFKSYLSILPEGEYISLNNFNELVKTIERIEKREENTIWLMEIWEMIVYELNECIMLTQEVNQGNVVKHDFSCLIDTLMIPFEFHLSFSLEKWRNLFKTFNRLASMVENVSSNQSIYELTDNLCKLELKPKDYEQFLKVFTILLETIDYCEDSTTASLFGSPRPSTAINHSILSIISKLFLYIEKNLYYKWKEDKLFKLLAECFMVFFKAMPKASIFQNAFQIFQKYFIACYENCSEKNLQELHQAFISYLKDYKAPYDSELLSDLSELFVKAFDKSYLVKSTTTLWNETFSKSNHLVYPNTLKEYFKNASLKLILPNWHQQTVVMEELGSREIHLESQVDLPSIPGILSPKKKTPTLSLEKSSINLMSSPKISQKSTKVSNPNPTSLNDMNSNSFIKIDSPPKGKRILTQHQKEILKEQRNNNIYGDTQDIVTNDTQMSQLSTETPVMELTPLPFSNIGVSSAGPKDKTEFRKEEVIKDTNDTVEKDVEDEHMEIEKKDESQIVSENSEEVEVIEEDVVTDISSKLSNSSPTKSNDLRSRKQSFDENVSADGKIDKCAEVVKERSNVLRSPNIMQNDENRRKSNRGRKRKLSLDANIVKQKEDKIVRKRRMTRKSSSEILSHSEPKLSSSFTDKRKRSKRARTKLDFSGNSKESSSPFFVEETEDSVAENDTSVEKKDDGVQIVEDTIDRVITEKLLESKKLVIECQDELKEAQFKINKAQSLVDEVPNTPKNLKCTKFPLVAPDPINSPSLKGKTALQEVEKEKNSEKDDLDEVSNASASKANKIDCQIKMLPVISGRQKPLTESPIKARTQSNELKRLVFSSPVLKKFERTKQINSSPTSTSDINIAITSKVSPGILKRKPSVSVEPSPKRRHVHFNETISTKDANGRECNSPMNLSTQNSVPELSQASNSSSIDSESLSQLNQTDPICGDLIDCNEDIGEILSAVCTSTNAKLVVNNWKKVHGIKTVGDLSKKSQIEVKNLSGIAEPKVKRVKEQLQIFKQQYERKRQKLKERETRILAPLDMEDSQDAVALESSPIANIENIAQQVERVREEIHSRLGQFSLEQRLQAAARLQKAQQSLSELQSCLLQNLVEESRK
ncbi:DgyrCDS6217 [Dimorphilus gyrociliatus]|uniref:DgyrCDS6217 n=1 Tax=Dimorphilus gyrociliatus TaxID=2664684 RepID=A0A7I8VP06_9ANNE|nr:DgyrCDS6217 [Dimorphilus gyrociliatus]